MIKQKTSINNVTASLTNLKEKLCLMVCQLLKQSPHFPLMHVVFYLRLDDIDPNKAHGPDELSPRLLKLVAEELPPTLTIIFQQSYDMSSTPKDWNSAIAMPIFKNFLKCDPSNYRPMSLACICSKIMEHIMLSHIAEHITTNNILINEQHVFTNKQSTITQLINTTTDWANTLNN